MSVGHLERRHRPAEPRARAGDLGGAQSGAPCAAAVPALVGAPKAMVVRQAMSEGRSSLLRARERGGDGVGVVAVDAIRSPSRAAAKRASWSSEVASAVAPSIEMRLSSHSTISRPSRRCPASEIASCEMPSIRQPSPAMT